MCRAILNYLSVVKNFFNNIDATYEQACMATWQGKCNTAMLGYGQAYMLQNKENNYTELSIAITTFNDNNKSPLSSVKTLEGILKVVMEDKEE